MQMSKDGLICGYVKDPQPPRISQRVLDRFQGKKSKLPKRKKPVRKLLSGGGKPFDVRWDNDERKKNQSSRISSLRFFFSFNFLSPITIIRGYFKACSLS